MYRCGRFEFKLSLKAQNIVIGQSWPPKTGFERKQTKETKQEGRWQMPPEWAFVILRIF
jgi:hypothetical protein